MRPEQSRGSQRESGLNAEGFPIARDRALEARGQVDLGRPVHAGLGVVDAGQRVAHVSGAGGVNPRSRNADNNARFRSVSRASAASTDAATRSLASSRSRVSSRPILSKRFVSSLAICFKRLITSATLDRSYPALEVLSTFRSPDSFLATAFFCLRPIACLGVAEARGAPRVAHARGASESAAIDTPRPRFGDRARTRRRRVAR